MPPLTDATLNLIGTYLTTIAGYLALHTADPGSNGANPSAAARQPCTFTVDADGDLTLDGVVAFTGCTPFGDITHTSLWSASSGGTFRGGFVLTGDQTANAVGEYSVVGLVIAGTSTG